MQISQRGIDLILESEGKKVRMPDGRYRAYLDTLADPPVPTIYAGLTKGVYMGMIITVEEGERMFAKELGVYEDAVDRLVRVPLNQNQFDALVSFVYNCGPGALAGSTLLKELNKGRYAAVPGQLARWNKAGGKVRAGLVKRRKLEGDLFMELVAVPVLAPGERGEAPTAPTNAPSNDHLVIPAADVPHDLPDDHMPQRPEESKGDVTAAAKESWTIRGAAAAIGGALLQAWDWAFSTARDAGAEIVAMNDAKGPFDALLTALKANMGLIAAVIVITGCGIAIARRLHAAKEMKVG